MILGTFLPGTLLLLEAYGFLEFDFDWPTSGIVLRSSFYIEKDVTHRLAPVAALELIGVGLVDGIEVILPVRICVITKRTYRPMCADMCGERPFSWPNPEFE
jgi:hypothetical protein